MNLLLLTSLLLVSEIVVEQPNNATLAEAITGANAQVGRCKIIIPAGDWRFGPADLPAITSPDVTIEGVGNASRLHLTGGTYFRWVSAEGGGIKNLVLLYDRMITDPAPTIHLQGSVAQRIYDVECRGGGTFLKCSDACHRCWIDRLYLWTYNVGWPAIILNNGTGFILRDSSLFVNAPPPKWNIGTPAANWPPMETKPGADMLLIDGSWDTCRLINVNSQRWYRGVNISPKGEVASNILYVSVEKCVFDYIRENVVYVNLPDKAALNSLIVDGGLHDTWEGDCFSFTGKRILSPSIRNTKLLFSGRSAVKTGPDKITELSITNNTLSATSRLGVSIPAISLGPIDRAVVTGNQIGGRGYYWGDVQKGVNATSSTNSNFSSNVVVQVP